MTEIKQLKADIETLKRLCQINGYSNHVVKPLLSEMQEKLKDLEAQPVDVWATGKKVLEYWNKFYALPIQSSHTIAVLRYATHLEARVTELERKGQS